MPRAIIGAKEIQERLRALFAGEVQPVVFRKSAANSGLNLTNDAFASFTADKSYAIVGAFLSGIQTEVTTVKESLIVLSKTSQHGHYPTGGIIVGSEIASLVFRLEGSKSFVFGSGGKYGEERHNVFLEKGQTIYAHLHTESADGTSVGEIVLYLLPVGDQ